MTNEEPSQQMSSKALGYLALGFIGVALAVLLATCGGNDDPPATGGAQPVPVPPAQESNGTWIGEPQSETSLTAAEEFEVELLVAMAFIDPETLSVTCDFVNTLGADTAAEQFASIYSPELTASNLPYNQEGAAQAFETWCSTP